MMFRGLCILLILVLPVLLGMTCDPAEQAAVGGGGASTAEPMDENEDGKIDGVPDAVNDIFTVAQVEALREAGLNIHTGEMPTNAQGNYLASTLRVIYDSLGLTPLLAAYLFAFYDQQTDQSLQVDYTDELQDTSIGNPAYIAGEDSCFSIFSEVDGYSESDDCQYARPTVFSACLDNTMSLAGFAFGFIMTAADGDCSQTVPVGHMRVIAEGDGLAVRH